MKVKWTILALSVILIGGCNSNGSSSSKDTLYRQIFVQEQVRSPASENQVPNMINSKEFNPSDYAENYKSPDFREFYDPNKPEGYGIEAFAVLVESTPSVNKYVYIYERIDYTDLGLGGTSSLPEGPLSYTGELEYYDLESDPDLNSVNKSGTFKLTKTFHGSGANSIELDWDGNEATPNVVTNIVAYEKHPEHDFTFTHEFPNSEKKLIGHGTFHQNWQNVYGLFKSPNYAGGFKGSCQTNCTN